MKLGDKVFVNNVERCYTNYTEWIKLNASEYSVYYSFGYSPSRNKKYTVVAIAPHTYYTDVKLCLIQGYFMDCYLVDMLALSKYNEEESEEIED